MDPDRERLALATSINGSFQANIQHADTKAGMLAVACSGMVTAMLTQSDHVFHALRASPLLIGPGLAAWASALIVAVVHLARVLRPRTAPPAPDNHFAFPAVATGGAADLRQLPADELCDQAAALGGVLARIAMVKYRAVGAALTASVALATLTVACLILAAMVS